MTLRRMMSVFAVILASFLAADLTAQTFCAKPKPVTQPPPSDPYPPVCEPKKCEKCSKSPCYLASGTYVNDFVDLQIPTAGIYPLTVSRRYESGRPADGPLGVGWSSSLTARLYYATYLRSAPSTYSYEADVIMPDGVLYRFTINGSGAFVPPLGRYETLVRNGDGTYTLTLQRSRAAYRFNADGSIGSFTDEYGNQIAYTYDADGKLKQVADSAGSGRYIDVTFALDGRIASLKDNSGRIFKYFYETGNGTLTSFSDAVVSSDASQRTTYYSYVSARFGPVLSRIEDRWHRVISELEWYSNGKLKSYTEGRYDAGNPSTSEGEKYSYVYAPGTGGGSVTKTGSLGAKTYNYSSVGLVNDLATYDSLGQVTSESTGTGTRSYTYNALGNVVSLTDAAATWTYAYDPNFPEKVASITTGVANWGGWKYDYNPPGTAAAGALSNVYRMRTDNTTKDQVAAYTYDEHGHMTRSYDDNMLVTVYTYNATGDVTSVSPGGIGTVTYTYDSLGRRTSMTGPDGHVTTFAYDALDRLTSVTLPKPVPSSTLNFVTTYSYDNYDSTTGLVFTNVTDPNGRVTKSGYDSLGHVVRTIDAAGSVTKFTYQYGLLKKITDANGNETTYTYNGNRELSATTFPDGATESYTITNGVLFSRTDRKGQTVSYTYDGLGRIRRVSYAGVYDPSGGLVGQEFTYEGQNLMFLFDHTPAGVTRYEYTYDSSWRRTVENIFGGEKTTYTYVNGPTWQGSLLASYKIEAASSNFWNPQTVTYGYDPWGRVNAIAWNWIPNGSFTFEYMPAGQYRKMAFPNGQTRNFSYDNQGRLTNVTNSGPGGNLLASFDYGYDTDWGTGTNTMLGQRTSVYVTAMPGTTNLEVGTTKYRYDPSYQLIRADHPNGQYETWTYDAIGNRTSTLTSTYTYYKNGQNPLNGQRLRSYSAGFPDLLYDANGNLTGSTNLPNTYVWDYAGRLTSSSGVSYAYDHLGRRRSATSGNSTTKYVSFGLHTVAERNTTTGVATDYLFGPGIDEPLAKITANAAISYYGADGLGSIVLLTDANGTITSSTSYDAWGSGTGGSELFGYTGREGSFFRARYYAPGWGRFLSEDPAHYLGTSAYAYVGNMPVSYVDPSGAVSVSKTSSSHDEDWQDVIRHCGGRYVNGCANLRGRTTCSCSAGCDLATHQVVYTPNVSITVSIDVHIATNSPYEQLARIKQHEYAHVATYNQILKHMTNEGQALESRRYSTMFGCNAACFGFLAGSTAYRLAVGIADWIVTDVF